MHIFFVTFLIIFYYVYFEIIQKIIFEVVNAQKMRKKNLEILFKIQTLFKIKFIIKFFHNYYSN